MNIVYLIVGLTRAGAETQLVDLAGRMRSRGWGVTVVVMLPPQDFVSDLEASGISVVTLGMRRGIPDPRAVFRLARLLRQWRPDVLHSHMAKANILGRVVRLFARVPVEISTVHSIRDGGRITLWAYRVTDWLCHLTTGVSRAVSERYVQLRAVPSHKMTTIVNGVDTRKFACSPADRDAVRAELQVQGKFVWVAVGRFEEAKDYFTMVRAFAELVNRCPACVLVILGEGSLRNAVEQEIQQLGIAERVILAGLRKDVLRYLSASDAYVLSSVREGLPLVLLEAAACGLPIVATDVGGNREIVLDGTNGIMVPSGDPHRLCESMQDITELSEAQRRNMGAAGVSHVRANFDLDRVADRWEATYREVVYRNDLK